MPRTVLVCRDRRQSLALMRATVKELPHAPAPGLRSQTLFRLRILSAPQGRLLRPLVPSFVRAAASLSEFVNQGSSDQHDPSEANQESLSNMFNLLTAVSERMEKFEAELAHLARANDIEAMQSTLKVAISDGTC